MVEMKCVLGSFGCQRRKLNLFARENCCRVAI